MKTFYSFSTFAVFFAFIFSSIGAAEDQESMQNDFEKREFIELKKHIPKNYELVQIGNINGIEGFVQSYKVSLGAPMAIEQACHRKLVGVKIKEKEFRIKHPSGSDPSEANAISISNPILISPIFPKNLKKSVVPTGGREAACLLPDSIVWSEPLDISGVEEAKNYFVAVPPGIKVRVRALVDMEIDLVKNTTGKENRLAANRNKQALQSDEIEVESEQKVTPAR